MMAQKQQRTTYRPPYETPENIFGQYATLGKSVGGIPEQAVEGYIRGSELGIKQKAEERREKESKLAREMTMEKLEEIRQGKMDKKEAVEIALNDIRADYRTATTDISESELKKWTNKLKSQKDAAGVADVMADYAFEKTLIADTKNRYPDEYGSEIIFAPTDPAVLGSEKVREYSQGRMNSAENAYQNRWVKQRVMEYLKEEEGKASPNPNEQEALQYVYAGKHGSKLPQDAEGQKAVLNMFPDQFAREKLRIAEIAARSKAGETSRKGERDVLKRNQDSKKITDSKIDKAYNAILKATGEDFRSKIKPIDWENLAEFQRATKGYEGKQLKVIEEKGKEIAKQAKVSELYAIASEAGEVLSEPLAEAIIIDMEDGIWDSPYTKKYAPLTGATEWGKDQAKEEPKAEPEGPSPKPKATPQPQAKVGEYTPEQESLIDQYMKQYPGYTRDKIIEAMKSKGYL